VSSQKARVYELKMSGVQMQVGPTLVNRTSDSRVHGLAHHSRRPKSTAISTLLLIDHLHLTTASPRSFVTVKMLIPKADRKKIHELVYLYTSHQCGAIEKWTFAQNIQP
jgi:hypothetical protein